MRAFTDEGDREGSQRQASFDEDSGGGDSDEAERSAVGLHMAVLVRTIEHEIIPRLMLAHRHPQQSQCLTLPRAAVQQITAEDVEGLAQLVLSPQEDAARACVEKLRLRGISLETLCLDLLAPVARHLGDLWQQDLCDFGEVTLGLGRLQQVLRELSPAFGEPAEGRTNGRRILLLPGPGEQHTFGLVMVAEFFRRDGWDVAGGSWEAGADPVVMVRQEWFDVVGFSLGSQAHLDELGECIGAVRKASLNPEVVIIVGGPVFSQHPEFGALVQADAVATDGRQATELAGQLVDSRPRSEKHGVRASQCHRSL